MLTRFFIALLPPQTIQDYANGVVQELGDRFHTHTAKARPHITLQPPFEWSLPEVNSLVDWLATFAAQQTTVPITLSGFGAFAPRVLFIKVLKTPELLQLQVALMQALDHHLGIVAPHLNSALAPHLTVASRNLTPSIFKQAWADLQTRNVTFEFVGDRLTLLRHDGHQWHIHQDFPVKPQ